MDSPLTPPLNSAAAASAIERFAELIDALCATLMAELCPKTWFGKLFGGVTRRLAERLGDTLHGISERIRALAAEVSTGGGPWEARGRSCASLAEADGWASSAAGRFRLSEQGISAVNSNVEGWRGLRPPVERRGWSAFADHDGFASGVDRDVQALLSQKDVGPRLDSGSQGSRRSADRAPDKDGGILAPRQAAADGACAIACPLEDERARSRPPADRFDVGGRDKPGHDGEVTDSLPVGGEARRIAVAFQNRAYSLGFLIVHFVTK